MFAAGPCGLPFLLHKYCCSQRNRVGKLKMLCPRPSSFLIGQERSKEGHPRVAVNSLSGHMPGGRKPGMNHPLFAQVPVGYEPGPAQLQVGSKVKILKQSLPTVLSFFVVKCRFQVYSGGIWIRSMRSARRVSGLMPTSVAKMLAPRSAAVKRIGMRSTMRLSALSTCIPIMD